MIRITKDDQAAIDDFAKTLDEWSNRDLANVLIDLMSNYVRLRRVLG